jgi:hypothetical protein
VGDTFDALTTNRPYQKAYDPIEAMKIIQNLSGQRLDPAAVAALMAVFKRGEITIEKTVIPAPPEISAPPIPPPVADSLPVEILRS